MRSELFKWSQAPRLQRLQCAIILPSEWFTSFGLTGFTRTGKKNPPHHQRRREDYNLVHAHISAGPLTQTPVANYIGFLAWPRRQGWTAA